MEEYATFVNSLTQDLSTYINNTQDGVDFDQISEFVQKYGLLQTIAKQGVMRLVVTEGEIETKITFSTWNNSSIGYESDNSNKARIKTKDKRGVFGKTYKIYA